MDDITASSSLMGSICLLGVLPLASRQPITIQGNISHMSHGEEGGWKGEKSGEG